jgi:uncharacterized protein YjiS (DUF1127 family)
MRDSRAIARAAGASAIIVAFPKMRRLEHAEARQEWRGVLALLRLWRRRWLERREMRDLALLQPVSVLEDAGISREEAWRRARTPFWSP